MPRPYSEDLRLKAVQWYEKGESTQAEVAEHFGISLPSFCRYWSQYQKTGKVNPITKYHRGKVPLIHGKGLERLKKLCDKYTDATLVELSEKYYKRYKIKVSKSVMGRACEHLGLSRKKKSLYAQEQERPDIKKSAKLM